MAGRAASTATGFAAMITSAVADTRKPYSIPMPLRHYRNIRLKRGPSIGPEAVCLWSVPDADDGLVNGVTTVPSTGHSILDKAAEKALYRWKFPDGVVRMMIPVTFTTKEVQISYGTGPKPSSEVGSQNSGVPEVISRQY